MKLGVWAKIEWLSILPAYYFGNNCLPNGYVAVDHFANKKSLKLKIDFQKISRTVSVDFPVRHHIWLKILIQTNEVITIKQYTVA